MSAGSLSRVEYANEVGQPGVFRLLPSTKSMSKSTCNHVLRVYCRTHVLCALS